MSEFDGKENLRDISKSFNNTKLVIIASFCLLVLIVSFETFKYINEKNNSKVIEISDIVGIYKKDNNTLYLREDNSFRYYISDNEQYTGTYELNGHKIALSTKIKYGKNNCYYNNSSSIKDYSAKINYNMTITMNKLKFKKDTNIEETEIDKRYYSASPTNGGVVDETHRWEECVEDKDIQKDKNDFVGNYKYKDNNLYIREDNTFRYDKEDTIYVGTYTIEDNQIILDTSVTYEDVCFKNKIYKFIINVDSELKLDETINETDEEKYKYVINPKDGVKPKNSKYNWTTCNNIASINKVSDTGIYNELGYILQNTLRNTNIFEVRNNIFKDNNYKSEFAFWYGYVNKYYEYDINEKEYILTNDNYSKLYKNVYNEEIDRLGDYKSSEISNLKEYIFSEVSNEYKGNSFVSSAYIYENIGSKTKGKEKGSITIKYYKQGKDTIFTAITIYKKSGE